MNITMHPVIIAAIREYAQSDRPMHKILHRLGFRPQRFYLALRASRELRELYAQAKIERSELFSDQIVEIADTDANAMQAGNRIRVRQWLMERWAPGYYSPKVQVTTDIGPNLASIIEQGLRRAGVQTIEVDNAEIIAIPGSDDISDEDVLAIE
jgi:hypothetical protein